MSTHSDKGNLHDAFDGLMDVTFGVLRGNMGHASRLCSECLAKESEIDLFQELARFWSRAARDTGQVFTASQDFFEKLSSSKSGEPTPISTTGPASAANPAASFCSDPQVVGPFRTAGVVQASPLRRRGDDASSITSDRITVKPTTVSKGDAGVQVGVQCGGAARGLYVGTLMIGSEEISYNIYIDPG